MNTLILSDHPLTTGHIPPVIDRTVDVLGLKSCLQNLNKQLKEMNLSLNFHSEDIEPYLFLSGDRYMLTEDKIGELYARYTTSILEDEEQQKQNIAHLEMEIHHTETVIRELTSQTGKDIRRRLKEARLSALNHGKTSTQYREASVAEEAVLGKFYERGRREIELGLLREKYAILEKTSQEFGRMKIGRMEKFKDTLQSIQIAASFTKKEPENPREQKKKPKNIGIRIAAAVAVIVGGATFLKPASNQNSPNGQKNIPAKIHTAKNVVTEKFATNFGPVIIQPNLHFIDDSKRLADINKVISEAQFPTELPEITDQTLKTDLLRLFTKNMKDKMPDYIYNERSITGTLIKEQRFNWEDMTTEVDIIVHTKFNGEIRTTKKAKLVNQKDWKWKG